MPRPDYSEDTLTFSRDWNNRDPDDGGFATYVSDEATVRYDQQYLYDETKDFINEHVMADIEAVAVSVDTETEARVSAVSGLQTQVNAKITNPTGAEQNKFLTTDAGGNPVWSAVPSVAGGDMTTDEFTGEHGGTVILPSHGGTGQSTLKAAMTSLANALDVSSDTSPVDTTKMINVSQDGSTVVLRSMSKLWDYVSGKISSVLGLTAANYGGNAATATSAADLSATLGVSKGGTGKTTHTSNAVLTGNGTSAVNNVATASGALYATSANGAASFGTLPVAQGGTGSTSASDARTALGITPANIGAAASSHTHAASAITSGTLDAARIPSLDAAKITTGTFGSDRIPSLDAAKITSGTFAAARIASNAVTSAKIADGAVTEGKIGSSAVTSAKIADGAVGTSELASGAVTTVKITDGNVTNAKIASGVAASKITGASTTLGAYTARRIYISSTQPSSPSAGDIWVKI